MSAYTVSESLHRGHLLPCVRDANNEIVANGCLLEDARLFAAAPDLLDVLERIVEKGIIDADVWPDTANMMLLAIAKAKGENA